MKYVIPKGWKSALPFFFAFWKKEKEIKFRVRFTASCRYELPQEKNVPEEHRDINKLFGFGWWDWEALLKFKRPHHIDSARVGWRYWKSKDMCELLTYTYVEGKLEWTTLLWCYIELDYDVAMKEKFKTGEVEYYASGATVGDNRLPLVSTVQFSHDKEWKYRLNPRFGGDFSSPHKIELYLTKLL